MSIIPTEVFYQYRIVEVNAPGFRQRGQGERAALEVLNNELERDDHAMAFLLYEDSDLKKRKFLRELPENVATITTGDLLFELESFGLVRSYDTLLDKAEAKGRNVNGSRQPSDDDASRMLLKQHIEHIKDEDENTPGIG